MTSSGTGQAEVVAALRDPTRRPPAALTGGDAAATAARFDVHRNNVHVSLVEALEATFPAVSALVGEAFSRAMARAYVGAHLPRSPVLLDYGGGYPDFIRGFPPAIRPLPYLGDVAEMDWRCHEAYHAADAAPLRPDALGRLHPDELEQTRLVPHPAARVVASPWPALSIWRANRGQPPTIARTVDATRGGETALLARASLTVTDHALPAGGARFVNALWKGDPLGRAVHVASAQSEDFDVTGCLRILLDAGALAGIQLPDPTERGH